MESLSHAKVLIVTNMGLPKGGDTYGNGFLIVPKVIVVMTVAQVDCNMYYCIKDH